jgi:methylated-DNA-[protein]-cysteine S-methyltransferase
MGLAVTTLYQVIDSPVGPLLLTADESGLTGIRFDGAWSADPSTSLGMTGDESSRASEASRGICTLDSEAAHVIAAARAQLDEYFAGRRTHFDLPLSLTGTPFQRRVWTALAEIPFGRTISYLQLARTVGDERAVRAVGGANGRNPLPIVLPCHRVIGADGSLTGFGGGIERKRWLLEHEGAIPKATTLTLDL